jgi:TfuA-like protein
MRAAELSGLGMIGVGEIFEQYRTGDITGDDEVAVAHGEPPDYRKFSEALVNIRYALRRAADDGALDQSEAASLLRCARALPYTLRSWHAIEETAQRTEPWLLPALRRLRDLGRTDPSASDLKALDARRALRYLAGAQAPPAPALGWRQNPGWHTKRCMTGRPGSAARWSRTSSWMIYPLRGISSSMTGHSRPGGGRSCWARSQVSASQAWPPVTRQYRRCARPPLPGSATSR